LLQGVRVGSAICYLGYIHFDLKLVSVKLAAFALVLPTFSLAF